MKKRMLVYIASDNRSGSTLLDRLLGQHTMIISIGELLNLNSHVKKEGIGKTWQWRCTCGAEFKSCRFWSKIIELYEEKEHEDFSQVETKIPRTKNRVTDLITSLLIFFISSFSTLAKMRFNITNRANSSISENCYKILDCITQVAGKNVVVDSSKTPEQLCALLSNRNKNYQIKVIHLIRDGRAVCYSKVNRAKQNGLRLSYANAVISWVKVNVKILNLKLFFPDVDFAIIRYEELCTDTKAVMSKIMKKLGLPFENHLVTLYKRESHNIGGSPHRFSDNTRIRLDERWKSKRSKKSEFIFFLLGGFLNKKFGYDLI